MHDRSPFDAATVRARWDAAADGYADGQAAGLDYYRYDFFGPALVEMCGDVRDAALLDVGCGSGYFAREMARAGAHVTGVDISPRMIDRARATERASPLGIEYIVADAAELATTFASRTFDVATSCVALQDMPDPAKVFRAVHDLLAPGGRFIFAITHPFSDTPFRAWERDARGAKCWLCVDRCFDEGTVSFEWARWPGAFRTTSFHATLETWMRWILDAGFEIRALREPRPSEGAIRERPDLEDAARLPYFLAFDVRTRAAALLSS